MNFLSESLEHTSPFRRAGVALILGNLLMYLAWTVGYLWLPESLLRGKTGAGLVSDSFSESSALVLVLQILAYNAAAAYVVTPLVGKMAVGRLCLAYVLAMGHWTLYGLFLGTNSFGNPSPAVKPPSLSLYWGGTGPWEIAAYTLVAAAVARRYRIRQMSWLSFSTEKVPGLSPRLAQSDWLLLALSGILLLATAWVEAAKILGR